MDGSASGQSAGYPPAGMPANPHMPILALVLTLPLLIATLPVHAQGEKLDLSLPSNAEITAQSTSQGNSQSSDETSQRLAFLEQRLDAGQLHGQIWYYGWFAVNGGGLVYNTAQASTTNNHDNRVSSSVEAGKAAIGVADLLLRPLPARLGADTIRMIKGSPIERVHAAEALLRASAARAELNRTLWPHLGNAIINLVGGGIILAFGDGKDAAITTGVDFVVGEFEILSEPNRSIGDLAAYRSRYGESPKSSERSWYLSPRRHGINITFRF